MMTAMLMCKTKKVVLETSGYIMDLRNPCRNLNACMQKFKVKDDQSSELAISEYGNLLIGLKGQEDKKVFLVWSSDSVYSNTLLAHY